MLKLVGNIIWFIFGGFVLTLYWLLGAIIFAISIVGIPVSRAAFEMAKLSAFPFGKDVVHVRDLRADSTPTLADNLGVLVNIVWLVIFGIPLFIGHVAAGLLFFVSVIGIPFGLQSFKLAGLALWPVGRRVVTKEMAQQISQEKAQARISQMRGLNRA